MELVIYNVGAFLQIPTAVNVHLRPEADIRYVTVGREIACVNSYYFHQTEAEICL